MKSLESAEVRRACIVVTSIRFVILRIRALITMGMAMEIICLAITPPGCGAGEEAVVIGRDFEAALSEIAGKREQPVFDIVIIDPPYEKTDYYDTAMLKLQELGLVDEGSIVVCEHLYDNKLSDAYGKLSKIKEKKYGSIGVDLFLVDNRSAFC